MGGRFALQEELEMRFAIRDGRDAAVRVERIDDGSGIVFEHSCEVGRFRDAASKLRSKLRTNLPSKLSMVFSLRQAMCCMSFSCWRFAALSGCMLATILPSVAGVQITSLPSRLPPLVESVSHSFQDVLSAAERLHHPKHTPLEQKKVKNLLKDEQDTHHVSGFGPPLFVDVSSSAFPQGWYAWDHVGYPRRYACTPAFPDINGDGVLDFFYHNHYEMYPEIDWDLGISQGSNTPGEHPFYTNETSLYIVSTEVDNTPWTRLGADMHNVVFLDIDRDGLLDIYISTGGGMGMDHGPAKNPLVLWGEAATDVKQKFRGGRNIVEDANLQNTDSRGRFTYFLDFNKDGLLDVVFANDVRVDADNRFGYAMFNDGARKFSPRYELSEYASTMVLHDADGDGNADEFVIHRARCLPVAGEGGVPAAVPDDERLKFCEVRPEGSVAIYKYDENSDELALISPVYTRQVDGDKEVGRSVQTGDFDGDAVADLLVLYDGSINLYLSSKRERGSLPLGQPSEQITWSTSECSGRGVRVADLNLDGRSDVIVMCNEYGAHRMYFQNPNGKWSLRLGLGDLMSTDLPLLKPELLAEACAGDQPRVYLNDFCRAAASNEPLPPPVPYGIALVDWDNNGFLDVVLTHDVGRMMLLKNNFPALKGETHFIAIRLKGAESNDYGIGATLLLQARGMGDNQDTTTVQLREVYSAGHETDWWGSRDDRIIFGLGQSGLPEKLTVRWPGKSRHVQVIEEDSLRDHMNTMWDLLVVAEPGR